LPFAFQSFGEDGRSKLITSSSNPKVKMIRRLRDRKERQATGLYYLEGLRIVTEAVRQRAPIEFLLVAPELLVSDLGKELVNSQRQKGMDILEVDAEVFRSLALREGPQGLAAVARQSWSSLDEQQPVKGDLWVALHEAADPGNLGTILRTIDAIGGRGVILLDHTTDPYDPSAVRASMGAISAQKVIRTYYEEFSAWKLSLGVSLVGTSDASAKDYHHFHYPSPLILLMGSERQGLPEIYLNICDAIVSIPMRGVSDSLNLSVATAVILYEIYNQRRDLTGHKENVG
jgi:RNA methyltransferase, TrmH family